MAQVRQSAAEVAYLFRHAVVRDAVYELQLPSLRAERHLLAADVIEAILGKAEAAPEIADHLTAYRELTGRRDRVADEADLLRTAGQRAERQFDLREAVLRYLRRADLVAGNSRCEALHRAALAAQSGGMFSESERLLTRLQNLSGQLNDAGWQSTTASSFVNLYIDVGRIRDAQLAFEGSPGQPDGFTCARMLAVLDRTDEAEAAYRRVLASARAEGDLNLQSRALGGLSVLLFRTGRSDEGTPALREALALARKNGDVRFEGFWTGSLGVRLAAEGKTSEADSLYRHALATARASGDRRSETMWLSYLASNAVETERYEEGGTLHRAALELAREIGDVARESLNLGNLACLKMLQGALDVAEPMIERALELDRQAGSRQFEGVHLCDRARLHLLRGDAAQARSDWKLGTGILQQLGDENSLKSCRDQMHEVCNARGIEPMD